MGELTPEEDLHMEADRPGRVGIVDGRLIMERPVGNGAWPPLIPGEGVKVLYNGEEVKRPFVVESTTGISLHALDQEARSEFEIIVSPDKMKVILRTRFIRGKEFQICDQELTQKLRIKTRPIREFLPDPIDVGKVLAELEERRISAKIDPQALADACRSLEDSETVIAEGIPVQQPVHGRIEKIWEQQFEAVPSLGAEKIDHRERSVIESVDAGDVLAHWFSPTPGKPGRNVYGEVVNPPQPKNRSLRAGRGVKLVSNGTVAVAEQAGRPLLRNNVVLVSPQMVIEGNVDMKTGNIRFKGDVIVLGNVSESMEIEAGRQAEVTGNVCHAQITSGSDVIVSGKIISSSVSAGQHLVGLMRSLVFVKQLIPELDKLSAACAQLQRHPKFSTKDLSHMGAGYLIKLLLEMRFPQIAKNFGKLDAVLAQIDCELYENDFGDLVARLRVIAKHFIEAGPLMIYSRDTLDGMRRDLAELEERMNGFLGYPANITANYCQNATLEATGNITVTGSLAYGSEMVAGDRIHIFGDCRCGTYRAKSEIRVGKVGSKGMGKTYLSVLEGGTITAKQFQPGVRLKIGSDLRVLTSVWHNHTFRELDCLAVEAINE